MKVLVRLILLVSYLSVRKRFVRFLKENDAYETYCSSLPRWHGGKTLNKFMKKEALRGKDLSWLIRKSFVWSDTPEGIVYWSKLNEAWREECSKARFRFKY